MTHTLTPEQLAQAFHETYERLAPSFGYHTRPESAVPWDQVPEANRQLMIAVCQELLDTYCAATASQSHDAREQYSDLGRLTDQPTPTTPSLGLVSELGDDEVGARERQIEDGDQEGHDALQGWSAPHAGRV